MYTNIQASKSEWSSKAENWMSSLCLWNSSFGKAHRDSLHIMQANPDYCLPPLWTPHLPNSNGSRSSHQFDSERHLALYKVRWMYRRADVRVDTFWQIYWKQSDKHYFQTSLVNFFRSPPVCYIMTPANILYDLTWEHGSIILRTSINSETS